MLSKNIEYEVRLNVVCLNKEQPLELYEVHSEISHFAIKIHFKQNKFTNQNSLPWNCTYPLLCSIKVS